MINFCAEAFFGYNVYSSEDCGVQEVDLGIANLLFKLNAWVVIIKESEKLVRFFLAMFPDKEEIIKEVVPVLWLVSGTSIMSSSHWAIKMLA